MSHSAMPIKKTTLSHRSRAGCALLLTVFLTSLFLVLAVFLFKIIYNTSVAGNALFFREKALWLAEAGLEKGKVEMVNAPAWYTDLPHYPEEDFNWLKLTALGKNEVLGDGNYKVVREKGKNVLYSIGFARKAIVVLKIEFDPTSCHTLSWKDL